MNSNKNILVIVAGFAKIEVGEQFLDSMVKTYPKASIFRYSLITEKPAEIVNHKNYHIDFKQVQVSTKPIISSYFQWKFVKYVSTKIVEEIETIISVNKIDLVWVFLNSAQIIDLASKLVSKLDIPIVSHIWDSPQYLVQKMRFDWLTKRESLKSFYHVMASSDYFVTVSKIYTEELRKKVGVDGSEMLLCPPKEYELHYSFPDVSKKIKIVFAGTLYAFKQWNSFLDAIEFYNKINNRLIEVICIGNLSRFARKRSWVKYEKLKPMKDAMHIVNNAHIAYLPYWMDKSHEYTVKTAFPGKMSFYVSSGTPVFFHGPKISTPAYFLEENEVGTSCHTLEKEEIIRNIEFLISDNFRNNYKLNQLNTISNNFDEKIISDKFLNIVNKLTKHK